MMNNTNERVREADYMRAICSIWIIAFWHMPDYISPSSFAQNLTNSFTAQTTFSALAVFTCLSGYFSSKMRIRNMKDVIAYYCKRFIRIYPLFTVSCIAFALLSINPKRTVPFILLGLGLFREPYPLTIWFVCMLLLFYLLVPVLVYKLNEQSEMSFFTMAIFIEAVFFVACNIFGTDNRLFYYWPYFVLGLLLSKVNIQYLFEMIWGGGISKYKYEKARYFI